MKLSLTLVLTSALSCIALPIPSSIPRTEEAQSLLKGLTVAAQSGTSTYDRDKFKHWITVKGACNTRETVLERDGTDVVTDRQCRSTSGRWSSPYDGKVWTNADDLDIDHMVPLKNAWVSGASSWTAKDREAFANDLVRPQLWAVTDEVNQAKGWDGPEKWQPPLRSFACMYAKSWVAVKSHWNLTVTAEEKSALLGMVGTCSGADNSKNSTNGQNDDATENGSSALSFPMPMTITTIAGFLLFFF